MLGSERTYVLLVARVPVTRKVQPSEHIQTLPRVSLPTPVCADLVRRTAFLRREKKMQARRAHGALSAHPRAKPPDGNPTSTCLSLRVGTMSRRLCADSRGNLVHLSLSKVIFRRQCPDPKRSPMSSSHGLGILKCVVHHNMLVQHLYKNLNLFWCVSFNPGY
jgi:hypothetical protein